MQGAAKIAEADKTNIAAGHQASFGVAITTPMFLACPKGPVSPSDISFQTERHSQADFGDTCCEYAASGQRMDAVGEAVSIVHVVKKIGFDVEYRFKFFGFLQELFRQGRLSDDETCLGNVFLQHFCNGTL